MSNITNLTYAEVWEKLSSIDCSNHIEKKEVKYKNGGKTELSYLSWAWAWQIMMDHYPYIEVEFYEHPETKVPYVLFPDNTAEVRCKIRIKNLCREMWLPVMSGFTNSSVSNPSSRDVGDAKMRCMVKCLALFGLGHYIYAGEDLPANLSSEEIYEYAKKCNDIGTLTKFFNMLPEEDQEKYKAKFGELRNNLAR